MSTQSFRQWLSQQTDRRDPVGDLARDVMSDHPDIITVNDVRQAVEAVGYDAAIQALEDAAREFGEPID